MAVQFIKCIVYKHGLFDNRVLDFSDRLTVVYGKNGSGKSLLARSMVDAVWGKFTGRNLLGDDVWNSLYMDILFSISDSGWYRICNTSDSSYRVHYVRNNREKLLYAETKIHASGGAVRDEIGASAEGKQFLEFIDRIDSNTFMHSSFVPSSTDLAGGTIIDYGALKRILLNDRSDFYGIFTNLNTLFSGTLAGDALPPEVLRYEEKKRDLEKRIQIVDISGSRHEKLIREKKSIQREVDELNSSLVSLGSQKEILAKIIENLNKVEELKGEFEAIKDEIQDEQRKIKSISEMKSELDTMFPQFSDIDITDINNLDHLQEVFNDIRNLNEKIDTIYFSRELKKRKLKKAAVAIAAVGLAAVLGILARDGFDLLRHLPVWGGILGIVCAVVASIALYLFAASRDAEIDRLEEERQGYKERIKVLMEKSKVEVEDFKLTEIYELLLQYFEDYVNYTERRKDLARIKSSLKEEEYMVRIQNKLDALKREEEIIKDEIHTSIDTLNIVDDIENETSKIEELIRNIETESAIIREKAATKDRILQQIDAEFIQAAGNSGAMNALIEEKKSVDRILKKWKVNRNSMRYITETLARSADRSEEKQFRKLLDGTLEKFNHLTGNQYITTIDDAMLMRLITENRILPEMTPPVIHALLLSLKFTISDFLINGEAAIPLLIDEPFQFMDDERCGRFRDLVMEIARRRQVIIFTHHSNKRNWGGYIEL